VDELKRQTRLLDDDVKQLTEEVHRLNARQDKTDKIWRFLVTGLLMVLALVGLLGYVAFRTERNAREQADLAIRQAKAAQEQLDLRTRVLCPLYGLILGSYDPNSRDNNPDPNARQKYEDTFRVIREGYSVLECTAPLVPPRTTPN
jgi:hypothetical protein